MNSPLPRLLFVTGSTAGIEEYFYLSAVLPWVDGLRLHFEVEVVGTAAEVVPASERFAPDLVLFFGAKYKLLYDGPETDFGRLLGVPVAALTLMDGHSPAKQPFFEHASRLGVEAVFSIDTGMREMAGDFAEAVFYCPWFVNEEMCRDFGEKKSIPVALIGDGFVAVSNDWRYPWRRKVGALLREAFPVFSSPRPTKNYAHRMVGEAYGRMLNRSWLALSCGASRHIFMKKNLEIPASRCCLVTEPNATLHHLGFRDMENCVFAEPDNVVEKCRQLLSDPEALLQLTDRGRAFVLEQHSARNRTVIADWLALRQRRKAGERIVQTDVLGPLEIVGEESEKRGIRLSHEAPFSKVMQQAAEAWRTGETATANTQLTSATEMFSYTLEPYLLRAWTALKAGRAQDAMEPLRRILLLGIQWGAGHPDPLVWATYLLTLQLTGSTAEAAKLASAFSAIRHPMLDAVRAAVCPQFSTSPDGKPDTLSVVRPPWQTEEELAAFLNPFLEQARQCRKS